MTELTYLLERNLRIRRLARETLPQPDSIEVEEILGEVKDVFQVLRGSTELGFLGEEIGGLPDILKVKTALTLITEEMRSFLIRKALSSP